MRTLVHLSDLHFDRVDPALIEPLVEFVAMVRPDVVAVSGDLTQRARSEQFRQARRFLDRLPRPQIVVPGNHDISLYNIFRRFIEPLKKYRQYITDDLEPFYLDDEIAVLGINTARSLTFKGGRINAQQIADVRQRLSALDERITKVIVTHHPLDLPDNFEEHNLVGGAPQAMQMFSTCGADLLLAGHLHASHAGDTSGRYRIDGYAALAVQAGTATSTRGRGEPNSFNVVRIEASLIAVERISWNASTQTFAPGVTETFERKANVWIARQPSGMPSAMPT